MRAKKKKWIRHKTRARRYKKPYYYQRHKVGRKQPEKKRGKRNYGSDEISKKTYDWLKSKSDKEIESTGHIMEPSGKIRKMDSVERELYETENKNLSGHPTRFPWLGKWNYGMVWSDYSPEFRERARQKMGRGEPITGEELDSFEGAFPGMQILTFRKVGKNQYKMTGGPFGGEPGFEKDMSYKEALEDAKKKNLG